MNGFLLDTNVPSEPIRPQPDANVLVWLAAQCLDQLWISVVSFGEFRKGIELRVQDKRRTELELWLEKDLTTLFAGRILPLTRIDR
jgi:predicted nucleic acid-binding protein